MKITKASPEKDKGWHSATKRIIFAELSSVNVIFIGLNLFSHRPWFAFLFLRLFGSREEGGGGGGNKPFPLIEVHPLCWSHARIEAHSGPTEKRSKQKSILLFKKCATYGRGGTFIKGFPPFCEKLRATGSRNVPTEEEPSSPSPDRGQGLVLIFRFSKSAAAPVGTDGDVGTGGRVASDGGGPHRERDRRAGGKGRECGCEGGRIKTRGRIAEPGNIWADVV